MNGDTQKDGSLWNPTQKCDELRFPVLGLTIDGKFIETLGSIVENYD